jgi:hypothetical protein
MDSPTHDSKWSRLCFTFRDNAIRLKKSSKSLVKYWVIAAARRSHFGQPAGSRSFIGNAIPRARRMRLFAAMWSICFRGCALQA